MKITSANVMKIENNASDNATIDLAQILLSDILHHLEETCGNFGEGIILHNPATGEVVTEEELMRAKAVLDFFYGDKVLEIHY